jgi:hypothetical protein
MDIDEPWEYVDGGDERKINGPSYAEVASATK